MVNRKTQEAVQASLNSVTRDPNSGIAGIVFVAVDKDGNEIAACPSGKKGVAHDDPMDLNTVFWLASCTKLICAIACMQAVEQGILRLDDAKQAGHVPDPTMDIG